VCRGPRPVGACARRGLSSRAGVPALDGCAPFQRFALYGGSLGADCGPSKQRSDLFDQEAGRPWSLLAERLRRHPTLDAAELPSDQESLERYAKRDEGKRERSSLTAVPGAAKASRCTPRERNEPRRRLAFASARFRRLPRRPGCGVFLVGRKASVRVRGSFTCKTPLFIVAGPGFEPGAP
jgi:hypothetical protein